MRRLLALACVLSLSFGGLASIAQKPKACTIQGSSARDILAGTIHHDVVCAMAGGDYVHARKRDDIVRGGPGTDTLVGGKGHDRILGGLGTDRIFAIDQRPNDWVDGGDGNDLCYVDQGDVVSHCEHVTRGKTKEAFIAQSRALRGVTVVASSELDQPGCSPPPC